MLLLRCMMNACHVHDALLCRDSVIVVVVSCDLQVVSVHCCLNVCFCIAIMQRCRLRSWFLMGSKFLGLGDAPIVGSVAEPRREMKRV